VKGIDQYGIKFKPKRGIGCPRNLWIIENLGAQMHLKQLNPDNIKITKIPTMPMCDEEEKYHYDILWQQVERRHKLANGIPF